MVVVGGGEEDWADGHGDGERRAMRGRHREGAMRSVLDAGCDGGPNWGRVVVSVVCAGNLWVNPWGGWYCLIMRTAVALRRYALFVVEGPAGPRAG